MMKKVRVVDPYKLWTLIDQLEYTEMYSNESINRIDEKRLRMLKQYRQISEEKCLAYFPNDTEEALLEIKRRYPNAGNVVDECINSYRIATMGTGIFKIPNLLLVGPPGSGKTSVAKAVANAISPDIEELHLAFHNEAFGLCGLDLGYESGGPGVIVKTIAAKSDANFCWVIDEIDKTRDKGPRPSPYIPLYQLLEPTTAVKFKDLALDIELDTSYCSYIMTANEMSTIPDPILDRCVILQVSIPNDDQMSIIVQNIWEDTLNGTGIAHCFYPSLRQDVVNHLVGKSPRQISHVLKRAIGAAARRVAENGQFKHIAKNGTKIEIGLNDLPITDNTERTIGFVW